MGRDKALLPVAGAPMAARVAACLSAAGAVRVTCVGGDLAGLTAAGLEVAPDQAPGEGPLGGLLSALDRAREPIVVVLACDLVAPDPAAVAAVVRALSDQPGAEAAMPVVAGRRQVLHAAWRRSARVALRQSWDAGERSVRRAVASLPVVEAVGLDPRSQADADLPTDLPASLRPAEPAG
jgi:molybdopterin-guanine dinucleotide biosynthesis protein A